MESVHNTMTFIRYFQLVIPVPTFRSPPIPVFLEFYLPDTMYGVHSHEGMHLATNVPIQKGESNLRAAYIMLKLLLIYL